MAGKSSNGAMAGGVLVAFGPIVGAVVGLYLGEPSKGFLVGLGAGVGMAIAIWLLDRRR